MKAPPHVSALVAVVQTQGTYLRALDRLESLLTTHHRYQIGVSIFEALCWEVIDEPDIVLAYPWPHFAAIVRQHYLVHANLITRPNHNAAYRVEPLLRAIKEARCEAPPLTV